jgi:uncharacterized membrane protein
MRAAGTRQPVLALACLCALMGCSGGGGGSGDAGGGGGSPSVCNQTNATIHVAVAYQTAKPDGWASRGWTDIPAGKCTAVLPGVTLPDHTYYAYAYISMDKTTNMPDWGGYDYFCLAWTSPFENGRAKDNSNCTRTETKNEEWVGFHQVDASQGADVIKY